MLNLDPEDENEVFCPKLDDIKLTIGWKVINQTVVENTNAERKHPSDCHMFANDLACALENSLESSVNATSSLFF